MNRRLTSGRRGLRLGALLVGVGLWVGACSSTPPAATTSTPTVVATTPILADLASRVAGDRFKVVSLVPPGADPHTHELTMRGIRDVVYAKVALSNYLMLEQHSTIKSLDHNLPKSAQNVSLAEASTRYGAEVIPLVENHNLETLWLGLRVRGTGQDQGGSRSSDVEFSVTAVDGPGTLLGYVTGTFGQPKVFTDSADGFDARDGYARDSMRLPANAHTHMSWGFTAPGVYTLTIKGRLLNPGAQPIEVAENKVTFVVGVDPRADPRWAGRQILDRGHADIALDLDARQVYLWADAEGGGDARQRHVDLESSVIWVPPKALIEVPAGPQFRFLGRPGQQIHQLPQAVLGAHVHGEIDPHLWLNAKNAKAYVQTIRDVLASADPAGAATFGENARVFLAELDATDAYVADKLAQIPPERRHLVTTHDAYGYFAKAYGLDVAGFVAPNPGVEPSLMQRRKLSETLRSLKVPAVFLEPTVARDTSVLASLAADENVRLCTIYSDTLDRHVRSYVDLMRFNADSVSACLGKETK